MAAISRDPTAMSPKPPKTRGLRLSISSTTYSSSGELSAGSVTPSSSTTTFSVSPTSSLNVNQSVSTPNIPTYATPNYVVSTVGSVKEEPCTPGLLMSSSDETEENGDSMEAETSPLSDTKIAPKIEEPAAQTTPPIVVKRGRGRPRKNPPNAPETKTKITKGRSKTGCVTCRKRKKKCDEAKPECNNCGKNGYICEGYFPKTLWRSGKDSNHRLPPFKPSLPALIEGVESDLDRKLLNHFVNTVSTVLSQFGDENNPFKELLLPLAIDNSGLMHALLCLAAAHLSRTDSTAKNAQYYHKGEAVRVLTQGIASLHLQEGSMIDDSLVATTIVLCLEAICEGDRTGVHGHHIKALGHLAQIINDRARDKETEPHKVQFAHFFLEFFRYHQILDGITNMVRRPAMDLNLLSVAPFLQPEANNNLIGILDQLLVNISRITTLRDLIRRRKAEGTYPTIDQVMLGQAVEIDEEVRSWAPAQISAQPQRYYYGLLYQQVTWIYLYRTIQRSVPDPKIRKAVDEGLRCLSALSTEEFGYSVLLLPVFLLGCAAFDVNQRPEINKKFDDMVAAGLQNAAHAQLVVNKIWELMDAEDETSWDWERIIHDLGYDFLLS